VSDNEFAWIAQLANSCLRTLAELDAERNCLHPVFVETHDLPLPDSPSFRPHPTPKFLQQIPTKGAQEATTGSADLYSLKGWARTAVILNRQMASCFWRFKHLGRTIQNDFAPIHDVDMISEFATEIEILFDQQNGHPG